MRSIMGCAESGASNPYFYSVSGGSPGTVILAGARNIGRDLGAPCRKWGCSKHIFALIYIYIYIYMASSSGFDRVWSRSFFCDVQKCPELREKWGFWVVGLKFATWRSKSGFRKKGQNLFLVPHPSSFLCFSVSRLVFAKNGVSKIDENFAETTKKRSAKLARPQNAIFAPKGPKWAILVRATKRSRYICRCILLPFPFIFKKTRTIVWYFLLFPFLTTGPFLSF